MKPSRCFLHWYRIVAPSITGWSGKAALRFLPLLYLSSLVLHASSPNLTGHVSHVSCRQLLYFPFAPFFVIFETILHCHGSLTSIIEQDLCLLSTTRSFFVSMRSPVNLFSYLMLQVRDRCDCFSRACSIARAKSWLFRDATENSRSSMQQGEDTAVWSENPLLRWHAEDLRQDNEIRASIDALRPNVANFLHWLPDDIDGPWPSLEADLNQLPTGSDAPVSDPSWPGTFGSQGRRSHKRPFDSAFDWFGWHMC